MAEPFVCVNGIDLEAAARNQFEQGLIPTDTETWENVPEWVREEYRGHAQAIIAAALGECVPADYEQRANYRYSDSVFGRWVTSWQPVKAEGDQ